MQPPEHPGWRQGRRRADIGIHIVFGAVFFALGLLVDRFLRAGGGAEPGREQGLSAAGNWLWSARADLGCRSWAAPGGRWCLFDQAPASDRLPPG